MFYDIVFFKGAQDTVRLLPDGTYNVIKAPGRTIQAINGRPPVDQSAEVAALTAEKAMLSGQIAALAAQVAQLESDLAACKAGNPPPPVAPTITNMTVTPSNLPVGGGQVVIDADVTGANVTLTLKIDGVDVPGPIVLPKTATV